MSKTMASSLAIIIATAFAIIGVASGQEQTICTSDTNTFTVKVDLYAGELGYFYVEECGRDNVNPILGMEIGQTYTFNQADRSNYMHPLGFAYYPDGAHDDKDELEPTIAPPETSSTCATTSTCPAPMYFLNDRYLGGAYNNIGTGEIDTAAVVTAQQVAADGGSSGDPADFGLDNYEPKFFHPVGEWVGYGNFTIKLNFNETYDQDLFYFCHIHHSMSGRIKLLRNGVPVNEANEPPLVDGYYMPTTSSWDKKCGTYNLIPSSEYEIPCPRSFVCGVDEETVDPEFRDFTDCLDSMNCAMFQGMTTHSASGDLKALFMLQMIPHHQNAVNMAKTLLMRKDALHCDDLTADTDDCEMERILRAIINGQNEQIQSMNKYLAKVGLEDYGNDKELKTDCVQELWPAYSKYTNGDITSDKSGVGEKDGSTTTGNADPDTTTVGVAEISASVSYSSTFASVCCGMVTALLYIFAVLA